MIRRLMGLAIAVPAMLLSAGQAVAQNPDSSSGQVAACSYAAYAPNREGSLVRGWGEKWSCGGSTSWTITVQRHRGASWWQNEARNYATGDGWVSAAAGCVSGTWTYRTILESDVGHKTVSAHKTITCWRARTPDDGEPGAEFGGGAGSTGSQAQSGGPSPQPIG